MANYTISDLERISGIKAHTIRIWEKRYGLIQPLRTSTNIRNYCDAELRKLLNISILNKNGYKISKIAQLTIQEIKECVTKITEHSSDVENYIENLSIAMIDLDEPKFEKVLSQAIIQMGFEETVMSIIYPFFIRVGIMWQTGSINPSQEHFISNLVRQKILVAIDSQTEKNSSGVKTFLLLLPEGEMHELGLLFANYLIRKRNHRVIYLGQDVPLADIEGIITSHPCDYILTCLYNPISRKNFIQYLNSIQNTLGNIKVLVMGSDSGIAHDIPDTNISYIHSPFALVETLNSIAG